MEQWRDKQKMSMARSYHKMIKKNEKKAMYLKGGKKENPNLEQIGEKKSLVDKSLGLAELRRNTKRRS